MKGMPGREARWTAGMLLLLLLACLIAFMVELHGRYQWATSELDDIEPRYARLKGIEGVGGDIVAAVADAEQWLQAFAYPSGEDRARIGTELQQRIRQVGDTHGIGFAGSQILPVREEADFAIVSVRGTMEGEVPAFLAFMSELKELRPPVLFEGLVMQAPRQGRSGESGARVNVQASMYVMVLSE